MRVSRSVGNTAHGRRRHIRCNGENPYERKIEGKRQVTALALAGGFAAIVLAGRIVRDLPVRGVSRGCAVQRTILVMGTFVLGRGMRALRHRIGDVHLESKAEL